MFLQHYIQSDRFFKAWFPFFGTVLSVHWQDAPGRKTVSPVTVLNSGLFPLFENPKKEKYFFIFPT